MLNFRNKASAAGYISPVGYAFDTNRQKVLSIAGV